MKAKKCNASSLNRWKKILSNHNYPASYEEICHAMSLIDVSELDEMVAEEWAAYEEFIGPSDPGYLDHSPQKEEENMYSTWLMDTIDYYRDPEDRNR